MVTSPAEIVSRRDSFKEPKGGLQFIRFRHRKRYEFTRPWFRRRNQATFSTFLPPKFDGSFPIKILQIGVFEGADLCWQMENTGSHPDSRAVGIDPWKETKSLKGPGIPIETMEKVRERAIKNVSHFGSKVELIRGYSQEILRPDVITAASRLAPYDLVVIDGDHRASAVYEDGINALRLTKPGGWILFDDVRTAQRKEDHVIDGLKAFLEDYGDQLTQVWSYRFCECYEVDG